MTVLKASKGFTAAVDALKGVADDKDASDVEKEAAKKMLGAIAAGDAEDDDKEEKKDEAKAEDEEDKKPEASAAPAAVAAAAPAPVLTDSAEPVLAAAPSSRLAALTNNHLASSEAEKVRVKAERKAKREKLLASRPDFSPELRAELATQKLEVVEHYCKTLPVGMIAAPPVQSSLAASQAAPSAQGNAQPQPFAPPPGVDAKSAMRDLEAKYGFGPKEEKPAITIIDSGQGMQAAVFSVLGKVGKTETVAEYKA